MPLLASEYMLIKRLRLHLHYMILSGAMEFCLQKEIIYI